MNKECQWIGDLKEQTDIFRKVCSLFVFCPVDEPMWEAWFGWTECVCLCDL